MERTGGDVSPDRSDRDLVLAFKRGEEAAYDEMYERYRARVYGVCARILRNPQDAEEASQETFLRAFQALHRFNGRYQLGAWLARIAANTSVDQLRSKSRAPVVALPEAQEPVSPDADPERLVVGEYPQLQRAISDVKPLHAQAIALRALEGMSHQEIADRLALTPAQVKALLHRARNSLRRAWDRAEGWLLAPIFSIRALFGDRSDGQAPPLLSASGTLSPLLAERVATTALVVAVALGGFPVASTTASRPDSSPRSPQALAPQARPQPSRDVVLGEAPEQIRDRSEEEQEVTEEVSRLIEETLKGHSDLNVRRKRSDDRDDRDMPSDPTVAASEILSEARNVLPHGGPGSPVVADL